MAGNMGIILEEPVYKSFVRTGELQGGQGIHVALSFFSWSLHKSFVEETIFPLLKGCIELHKNLSERA